MVEGNLYFYLLAETFIATCTSISSNFDQCVWFICIIEQYVYKILLIHFTLEILTFRNKNQFMFFYYFKAGFNVKVQNIVYASFVEISMNKK